jgi:hypothetical protein
MLREGILWEAKRRTFTLSQAKVRSSNPSVRVFGLASAVIEKPNEGFFSSLLITSLSTTRRSQANEKATGIEGRDKRRWRIPATHADLSLRVRAGRCQRWMGLPLQHKLNEAQR